MRLITLLLAALLPATLAAPVCAEGLKAGETWREPNTGIEFVYIPAGCFDMGLDDTAEKDELPVHKVCVKAFMLSRYEITQEQYRKVTTLKPSEFAGGDLPVEQVSWDDAQLFVREMNRVSGQRFSLPSESQWEYACRAGGQHSTYCGQGFLAQLAWGEGNADYHPHPVGKKKANAWNLYDMSGNVREWVEDCYGDSYSGAPADGSPVQRAECPLRVQRGGAWIDNPQAARAANRSGVISAQRNGLTGFRLARTLP
jgi:formylglycine-generating enzyme required for sulfatase activity